MTLPTRCEGNNKPQMLELLQADASSLQSQIVALKLTLPLLA
jgi:hypothetical protein